MAVSTLSRSRAHTSLVATSLSPALLAVTLFAPLLDLLAMVQRGAAWPVGQTALAAIAAVLLLGAWARYPRTGWLAAAALAGTASVALRLAGADGAPLLSLLAVVALGVGGGFASPPREVDAWLA